MSSATSPAYDAMVLMHPYMLTIATVVIMGYGIYAGYAYPLLSIIGWPAFGRGYSHPSRVSTILFTQMCTVLFLTIIVYLSYASHGILRMWQPARFFGSAWQFFDYWHTHPEYTLPPLLFWYIYANLALDVVFDAIYLLLPRPTLLPSGEGIGPKVLEDEGPSAGVVSARHAFLVVCHNSVDKLRPTVEALLRICRPHQIFIADNGSSLEEEITTDVLCEAISDEYYAKVGRVCVRIASGRVNTHTYHIHSSPKRTQGKIGPFR
jgi:hypothetical protein